MNPHLIFIKVTPSLTYKPNINVEIEAEPHLKVDEFLSSFNSYYHRFMKASY